MLNSRDAKAFIATAFVLVLFEVVVVTDSIWWYNLLNSHGMIWNWVNRIVVYGVIYAVCWFCTAPGIDIQEK